MISVMELLYGIDLLLNKTATNANQGYPVEDKLIALNQAQVSIVKEKSTNLSLGLDANKKRYEELQMLIEPHQQLPLRFEKNSKIPKYQCNLSGLSNYMMFIDMYCVCSNKYCFNRNVKCYRVKHADLQNVLSNANTCPSFLYQETPITTSNNQIEIYTDGTFEVQEAYLTYLKYPRMIDLEGYIHFDGTASITNDCVLPAFLKDEIINKAVEILAISSNNEFAASYTISKNKQN